MASLEVFNVEHGQCILLTTDNAMRMMIDCGHSNAERWYPGDYLHSLGVNYLELLVVTNYDQDHISGFPNLISQVRIGSILCNTSIQPHEVYALKTQEGIASVAMNRFLEELLRFTPTPNGSQLSFPDATWHAFRNLYPTFTDENNLSLVLVLTVNGVQFVFPGDMEYAGWMHLLRTTPKLARMIPNTHVLLASHHGRDNGICPELFDEYGCKPDIILISDDYRRYDTQYTSGYYGTKASGITFRGNERRVLTTRSDGYIRFDFAENGCLVI